jgi:hypothetical protein
MNFKAFLNQIQTIMLRIDSLLLIAALVYVIIKF